MYNHPPGFSDEKNPLEIETENEISTFVSLKTRCQLLLLFAFFMQYDDGKYEGYYNNDGHYNQCSV